MKFFFFPFWIKFFFFLFIIALSSCTTRRDILISLDRSLSKDSVQVDLVGCTKEGLAVLDNCNYYQYWKIEGLKEKYDDLETEINFLPFSYVYEKSVSRASNIWAKWNSADCKYIFIAVDVPFKKSSKIDWKKALYLKSYSWYNFWSDRNLYVYVNNQGLTIRNE